MCRDEHRAPEYELKPATTYCGAGMDGDTFRFSDETFDLCEQHYKTSKRLFMHIDKKQEELKDKVCCKNYSGNCEFDSAWICKNPDCITPVITSTLPGAHPSGCPKIYK